MKLLKIFTFSKTKDDTTIKKNASSEFTAASDNTKTTKSSRKSRKSSRTSKSAPLKVDEIEDDKTDNEKLIEQCMEAWNCHSSTTEIENYFRSSSVKILFEEAPPLTTGAFGVELQNMFASFSDVKWNYESIQEVRPGVVLVENLVVAGTHDREPYKFAHFPPIPTTNKYFVVDPERIYMTTKDGKIAKMEVISLGCQTGPPGIYSLLGGNMTM